MKNLQINTSPIGAQEYNLGEKVGEDIYIYGEILEISINSVRFSQGYLTSQIATFTKPNINFTQSSVSVGDLPPKGEYQNLVLDQDNSTYYYVGNWGSSRISKILDSSIRFIYLGDTTWPAQYEIELDQNPFEKLFRGEVINIEVTFRPDPPLRNEVYSISNGSGFSKTITSLSTLSIQNETLIFN